MTPIMTRTGSAPLSSAADDHPKSALQLALSALPFLPGGAPGEGGIVRVKPRSQAEARLVDALPIDDLLPGPTIHACLRAAAMIAPDKPAIVTLRSADLADAPDVVSYGEMIERVERAANVFMEASQDASPVVVTILPMGPDALIASWAGSTAGISLPINPFLEPHYIASIMKAAKATVLVTATAAFGGDGDAKIRSIIDGAPSLKRVLIVDGEDPDRDFHAAIQAAPASLSFQPAQDPHADATYLLTGGTTAAPKMIRMTHRGQLLNAWLHGCLQGASIDGAVGHAMPNFHVGGAIAIALRTAIFSQTLVTLTKDGFRDPGVIANFWDIARRYRLTAVLATPTTAAALLADRDSTSDGHCLEAFACGGSTVPLSLTLAFHDRFGIWLREQWGMSEAHGTATGHFLDTDAKPRPGSVGYAFPYYDIKAVELDAANRFVRESGPGERGVLAIGGPIVPGYCDRDLDAGFFISGMGQERRWANTGDLGCVDKDGYVWIFGREKDVIVRGGHNIDPKSIEDILGAHPAVQLCAAIGKPDRSKGELPIAYVQLREGASVDVADLAVHCRTLIEERAANPVEIIIVDPMPTTAVGKISKPVLRIDAIRRVASTAIIQVLGDLGPATIQIDESGRRPHLIIDIEDATADRPARIAALSAALAGYEFLVTVG